MDVVQKVTADNGTPLSFIGGVLVPAGTLVNVPTSIELGENLVDPKRAVQAVPVPMSAIGPTGPFPTAPQQVPSGVFQGVGGYTGEGGAKLVAEGSAEAQRALDEGLTMDEDMPTRAPQPGSMTDADRAELETFRAAAKGQSDGGFNPDAVIDGTIPDVTGRLDGLTAEQLDAVQDAEDDREVPREGVRKAIDAARAKLA